MSFDLKISKGDIAIGSDGDFAKVLDTEKLIQDILKILLTPAGSNPFFPWYGSLIHGGLTGSVFDASFTISMANEQIRSALEVLQNLQKSQSSRQKVTASEQLAAIKSINVVRNDVDPRYFSIYVSVLSKALTVVNTSFDAQL